ncbi:uncharacterized protein LOC115217943 [Octopus sinensis]|uniref:Uncharacterized protein LOC115217943 n=1 Tax=Octopus sinensis TaxID=2607531 RepID=A0A6P7SZE6_9MOLL|nr:uncharacterized protein LOC115217943 [Octopus sinensis]
MTWKRKSGFCRTTRKAAALNKVRDFQLPQPEYNETCQLMPKFIVEEYDWKQILLVLKCGSGAQIVHVTLKTLYIWMSETELSLKKNMSVRNSSDATFVNYISDIGSGQCLLSDPLRNVIRIRLDILLETSSISEICKFVFDDLSENYKIASRLCSRALIASTNEVVNSVNEHMISNFPRKSREDCNSDITHDENYHQYTQAFLNNLNPLELPPHIIKLKMNYPIVLHKNSGPSNGTTYT